MNEHVLGWMDWLIWCKPWSVFCLKPVLYLCRFNFGKLGFWFPWSVVLLVLAAALFTYIALLLVRTVNCSRVLQYGFSWCWCCVDAVQVLAMCLLSEGQRLYLHWSHKVISSSFTPPSSPRLAHLCSSISVLAEKQLQIIYDSIIYDQFLTLNWASLNIRLFIVSFQGLL